MVWTGSTWTPYEGSSGNSELVQSKAGSARFGQLRQLRNRRTRAAPRSPLSRARATARPRTPATPVERAAITPAMAGLGGRVRRTATPGGRPLTEPPGRTPHRESQRYSHIFFLYFFLFAASQGFWGGGASGSGWRHGLPASYKASRARMASAKVWLFCWTARSRAGRAGSWRREIALLRHRRRPGHRERSAVRRHRVGSPARHTRPLRRRYAATPWGRSPAAMPGGSGVGIARLDGSGRLIMGQGFIKPARSPPK